MWNRHDYTDPNRKITHQMLVGFEFDDSIFKFNGFI